VFSYHSLLCTAKRLDYGLCLATQAQRRRNTCFVERFTQQPSDMQPLGFLCFQCTRQRATTGERCASRCKAMRMLVSLRDLLRYVYAFSNTLYPHLPMREVSGGLRAAFTRGDLFLRHARHGRMLLKGSVTRVNAMRHQSHRFTYLLVLYRKTDTACYCVIQNTVLQRSPSRSLASILSGAPGLKGGKPR
jgi:hypothetical protein